MRQSHSATLLFATLTMTFGGPSSAQSPNSVTGFWRTPDGAAIVDVAPCGQTLCGRLIWMREHGRALDERNPDRAKRSGRICGSNLFGGFRAGPNGTYVGGNIYDPEMGGSVANVDISARGNALTLSVRRGLFTGKEIWQRVEPPAPRC